MISYAVSMVCYGKVWTWELGKCLHTAGSANGMPGGSFAHGMMFRICKALA